MQMSRRALIGTTLAVAAATAAGVINFGRSGQTAVAAGGGGKYAPGPGGRPQGPGDMIMQLPNGRWSSHLLPFAPPFKDRVSLQAELKRARSERIIG